MKNDLHLFVLSFSMLLFCFSTTQATTFTFTAARGDWDVATNWQDNTIPAEPIASGDVVIIPLDHVALVPVGYTINNNGLISIAQTDGITREGALVVYGELHNNAQIATGRMEIYGLYDHNVGASITLGGTIYARPGGVFNIVGTMSGNFSIGNLGTLNVLPSGSLTTLGTFANIGTVVNNGTISTPIGMWDNQISLIKGRGTFTSNFAALTTTASTIAPGTSPGCLTFTGNVNNSAANHKLSIQINGPNPCTDYSKLIVNGTATVGGTLEIYFGFNPSPSQTFQIIEAASIVGSFSTVNILPSTIDAVYSAGVVTINAVLATELSAFTTQIKEGIVQLDWQTASEYQNKGFEVERSSDGNDWLSIGFVPAEGSSSRARAYRLNDPKPISGINYYRLRMIDKSGQSTFSRTKTVELLSGKPIVRIYPNPTADNITLQWTIEGLQQVLFELFDTSGKCLIKQEIAVNSPSTSLKLGDLKNGLYQIRLTHNQQVWVNRLVIQK
jgi:Secretion system C-terminal sorting domain